MPYSYELVVLEKRTHSYREAVVGADSFPAAFHGFLMSNRKLLDSQLTVYCRRPQSGDLKLMASYDGSGSIHGDGPPYRHILRLSDGRAMHLEETGFALNV